MMTRIVEDNMYAMHAQSREIDRISSQRDI